LLKRVVDVSEMHVTTVTGIAKSEEINYVPEMNIRAMPTAA
jgi:hypothetical protein